MNIRLIVCQCFQQVDHFVERPQTGLLFKIVFQLFRAIAHQHSGFIFLVDSEFEQSAVYVPLNYFIGFFGGNFEQIFSRFEVSFVVGRTPAHAWLVFGYVFH